LYLLPKKEVTEGSAGVKCSNRMSGRRFYLVFLKGGVSFFRIGVRGGEEGYREGIRE